MSPHSLFQVHRNDLIWKEELWPALALVEPEMDGSEHTMLEQEVAEIIISLLHQRRSDSGRQFRRSGPLAVPSDLTFPKWGVKRKRSTHTTVHARTTLGGRHTGESISLSFSNTLLPSSPSNASKENSGDLGSLQKSSKSSFLDKEQAALASDHCCPNVIEAYFKTAVFERGLLFWPGWRGNSGRAYVVPDLNMSAEELAEAELWRRQQHVLYEIACRRLAAADARRKRRELQKLKNSTNADETLCSRVK